MSRLETLTRFICHAGCVTGLVLAALVGLAFGGYLITIATPCLCFEANGLILLAGFIVILAGGALLLWISDIANLISGQIMKRLFRGSGGPYPTIQRDQSTGR